LETRLKDFQVRYICRPTANVLTMFLWYHTGTNFEHYCCYNHSVVTVSHAQCNPNRMCPQNSLYMDVAQTSNDRSHAV